MQPSAIALWTVLSTVAAMLTAFAVGHPGVAPVARLRFWVASTIALTMANVTFGLIQGSSPQLACGSNLFILLFHIGGASQTRHETRSSADNEPGSDPIVSKSTPYNFAFFLFALVFSSLLVGAPYQAIGVSIILSLLSLYLVRKLG
jgi:hypothetical protein